MSSNPDNDPFLEFTSRNDGQIPSVSEANRKRETKYRIGVAAVMCVLLWLGVKFIKLQNKITPAERPSINFNNLPPDQQEALLRIHGIGDNPIPSKGTEKSKQDETIP